MQVRRSPDDEVEGRTEAVFSRPPSEGPTRDGLAQQIETNKARSPAKILPIGDTTERAASDTIASTSMGPEMLRMKPNPGSIEPGHVLFDLYRVVRLLGRGGMGEVWLVVRLDLECHRALKLIDPRFASDPEVRTRFLREAKAMARVSHSHAVNVHHMSLTANAAFIEMEFVEGQSLDRLLKPGVPMPLDWVLRILLQLCDVLQVAHDHQIVHRDLKPSNLMLVDGRPPGREILKVLDFGIAKILDPKGVDPEDGLTRPGSFLGTILYTSPEQVTLGPVDRRTDLYTVGVILYELLTGHRPFSGSSAMHSHAFQPPPPLEVANPAVRVPASVSAVVLRCLAKKPEDRPQSALELARTLLGAVEGLSPSGVQGPIPALSAGAAATMGRVDLIPIADSGDFELPDRTTEASSPPASTLENRAWRRPAPIPEPPSPGWFKRILSNRLVLVPLLLLVISPIAIYFAIRADRVPTRPVDPPPVVLKKDEASKEGSGTGPAARASSSTNPGAPASTTKTGPPAPREEIDTPPIEVAKTKPVDEPTPPIKPIPVPPPPPTIELPSELTLNEADLKLVLIPEGTFLMGCPEGEGDPNEHPRHEVTISRPFYMGRTEVTQLQYARIMGENPSYFSKSGGGKKRVQGVNTDTHPVEMVSHADAQEFCRRLARRMGLPEGSIRLPTEAEWEYASRADPVPVLGEALTPLAWFGQNAKDQTHPVAQKNPNMFHLYDMAGNVAEWCSDWHEPYPSVAFAQRDPAILNQPEGTAVRVLRGGHWNGTDRACRPTDRSGDPPNTRVNTNGFRIVLDAEAAKPLVISAR